MLWEAASAGERGSKKLEGSRAKATSYKGAIRLGAYCGRPLQRANGGARSLEGRELKLPPARGLSGWKHVVGGRFSGRTGEQEAWRVAS